MPGLIVLLLISVLAGPVVAGSFELPAWSFERGNARVFTAQYADGGPMVAFGGESPVFVEYDVEVPAGGTCEVAFRHASAVARPVRLAVDGRPAGEVCRTATGAWDTSGAQWEEPVAVELAAGRHTLRLERSDAFPHLVAVRIGGAGIPDGFQPRRPLARKLPAAEPVTRPLQAGPDPAALRRGITDLMETHGSRYRDGKAYLDRLAALEAALADPARKGEAQAGLAALQREALLANPLLDGMRVLVLKRGFPQPAAARRALGDALGVGSLNAHTSDTIPRRGRWTDELAVLTDLRRGGSLSTVYQAPDGLTLIDPVVHFDGDRLMFARDGERERNWRVFELGLDGRGLRQVTPDDGADVGHFDPCYLPDGRLIFASTAPYQGLPCEFGNREMVCLYQLDPGSGAVRQLTFEQDSDWCPTVLPNGRLLYLRWEYTDQSHSNSRILFHMNPDGTDQREFRGSGSWFPGSFFYAKAIPGETHRVIGVAGGHHGTPRSGRLLILDPREGRRDGEGIVQEIPGFGRRVEPIVRDRLVDGVWPQFLMPCPLDARHHLVAAKLAPDALWGIYLVDVFDNITLVKEIEGAALLWPWWVRPVPKPPVIPDRGKPGTDKATVFIGDLHHGPGLQGVPRGTVKKVRVIEYAFSKRGFGGLYGTLGLDGPWDVKRILGTVPVEPDGSAFFEIPANTPISLQPLDSGGRALQLMRSWLVGMPGEAVSCAGCHESQGAVAAPRGAQAALRGPSPIEPWFGPARGFSFEREVQPVLDKHCTACHDGREAAPDLRGGRMLDDWSSQLAGRWAGGGKFSASYYELQRYVRRPGIEGDRRMFTPLDYHFGTTDLARMLDKGHHGVVLDREAAERLAAWADLNAPYFGRWSEIPQFRPDQPGGRQLARVNARAAELRRRYVPDGPHPDHEAEPAGPVQVAAAVKPNPPPRTGGPPPACDGWPFDAGRARALQQATAAGGPVARRLALADGVALELVRVPGGRFVMGSADGHPDEAPPAVVEVAPFWLARCETTNRQFQCFQPEHESRTEDRHGYQFGRLGYDQDQPDQPAVRVSWQEAVAFCHWLGGKTGLPVRLPDEAQWEWACRAGSARPFWFGDLTDDYSRRANLGDKSLAEFAADTAVDHYAAARPMVNPNRYDDWLPRDDRWCDGGLVTVPMGAYEANPWGLHDMHGNAAEWTRSLRKGYPFAAGDGRNDPAAPGERVVRGGSWRDRPPRATASHRLFYQPWQRVFDVGFRIAVEEPAPPTAAAHGRPR